MQVLTTNYPTIEVPDLTELLNRENFPEHDMLRFGLLKLLINDTNTDVDMSLIQKKSGHDIINIMFKMQQKLITRDEADLIIESSTRTSGDFSTNSITCVYYLLSIFSSYL